MTRDKLMLVERSVATRKLVVLVMEFYCGILYRLTALSDGQSFSERDNESG